MFSKDNIKFNIFFYMLISLDGHLSVMVSCLPLPPIFSTLLYLLRYLLIHCGS